MKILGKPIAEKIFNNLKTDVERLKQQGIIPRLAVIFVGNNPRSISYITQKKKQGEYIGATVDILQFDEKISEKQLIEKIEDLNRNVSVNGILIQQPLPHHLDAKMLLKLIKPEKEVDGLSPQSPYTFPLVNAALEILEYIFTIIADENAPNLQLRLDNNFSLSEHSKSKGNGFLSWLASQSIVVLGKGGTGGGPIITKLTNLNCKVAVIDSKTENIQQQTKQADIIISAVGKRNLLKPEHVKPGVILIGIGIGKDENGLYGDYNEHEVENIASFYTPTPGGVGPVNVACLMQNLIAAATTQK